MSPAAAITGSLVVMGGGAVDVGIVVGLADKVGEAGMVVAVAWTGIEVVVGCTWVGNNVAVEGIKVGKDVAVEGT